MADADRSTGHVDAHRPRRIRTADRNPDHRPAPGRSHADRLRPHHRIARRRLHRAAVIPLGLFSRSPPGVEVWRTKRLSPASDRLLAAYPWPGNVHQLTGV